MMRELHSIVSKQTLIVFLALLVTAVALLGGPSAGQILAESPPLLSQAGSGSGWTLVPTSPLSPPPSARYGHAMTSTPSEVLLFGGQSSLSRLNDTWLFNAAANTWAQIPVSSPPPVRYDHAMTSTPSGDVLLFGGAGSGGPLGDTWLFNATANTWEQIPVSSPPPARCGHAMTSTPSGDVLLFGGYGNNGTLNDTWLFNIATSTWSQLTFTTSTPSARIYSAMTATPSGNVLLFGGATSSGYFNDTWLFNIATKNWSQVFTSPTPPARCFHAMTSTPSGDVVLFGGSCGGNLNDTWLFNAATNTWEQISVASSPSARYGHAMAATHSGDVLLFGGYDISTYFNDTWIYETDAWALDLKGGWNLISLPLMTSPTPTEVFGGLPQGWVLFAWDAANSRYLGGAQISLAPGIGYWLKLPGSNPLSYSISGQLVTGDPFLVPLSEGWNIVGTPYLTSIAWGNARLRTLGHDYALSEAVTKNYIAGAVYYWTGSGYGNAAGGNFEPGKGYWLKAKMSGCSLVYPSQIRNVTEWPLPDSLSTVTVPNQTNTTPAPNGTWDQPGIWKQFSQTLDTGRSTLSIYNTTNGTLVDGQTLFLDTAYPEDTIVLQPGYWLNGNFVRTGLGNGHYVATATGYDAYSNGTQSLVFTWEFDVALQVFDTTVSGVVTQQTGTGPITGIAGVTVVLQEGVTTTGTTTTDTDGAYTWTHSFPNLATLTVHFINLPPTAPGSTETRTKVVNGVSSAYPPYAALPVGPVGGTNTVDLHVHWTPFP